MDRRRYIGLVKMTYFHHIFQTIAGVLVINGEYETVAPRSRAR